MKDERSAQYYARRREQELKIASRANDPHIAQLHRQLANEYDRILSTGGEPPRGL